MKIEVRLYASLERYMPGGGGCGVLRQIEVAEGTTVLELLESLHVPVDMVKLIFLNGIQAQASEVLKEGDRLGVFPPVAGG